MPAEPDMVSGSLRQKYPDRAWLMLLGAMTLMFNASLHASIYPLFIVPVSLDLGLPRTPMFVYTTVMSVTMALCMPIWSKLKRRVGLRGMLVSSGVVVVTAFLVMSRLNSILPFFLCAAANGFGAAGSSLLPAGEIVSNWFKRRGLFIGITMASSGIGNVALAPIINGLIRDFGWRAGFVGMAAAAGAVTFIPSLWLAESPNVVGAASREPDDAATPGAVTLVPGVAFGEAKRSPCLRLIIPVFFLMNVCVAPFSAVLASQARDLGYGADGVTFIVSFFSVMLILAKILLGVFADTFGAVAALAVAASAGCAGMIFVGYGAAYSVLLPSVMAASFGAAINNTFPPLLTSKLFGLRDYPAIFSLIQSAGMIGYACGVPLFGVAYDNLGSYMPAYAVAAALTLCCVCLLPRVSSFADKLSCVDK
jgi:MFS family permease